MNEYIFPGLYFKTQDKVVESLGKTPVKKLSVKRLASIIGRRFKITEGQLFSKSRKEEIREARHWLIFFLYEHSDIGGYKNIAKLFGLGHATVIHAHKKIKIRIEVYQDYKDTYNQLIKRIQDD